MGVRADSFQQESLSEVVPSRSKTPDTRNASGSGYPKGDKTRRRILGVALKAFGEDGFRAVSTRRIAQAFRVTLPVLQYHFGNKEGLYRACAEAIVQRYAEHTPIPPPPRPLRSLRAVTPTLRGPTSST